MVKKMSLNIDSSENLNQARILGHLGKDPEYRTASFGKEVAYLSVATNSNDCLDKKNLNTQWHSIEVWGEEKIAQLKEFAKKGTKIYIEGELKYIPVTDKFSKISYKKTVISCNVKDQMKIYGYKIEPLKDFFDANE